MAHATAAFDDNVRKIIEKWKVPGLAIAVVNGDTIHARGYGFSHLNSDHCTENTLFDCASTSKSFTAACVALLVESDAYPNVQWRTPVSKILPEDFVLLDPYLTANVTIEDILSHRTGDPGHDNSFFGHNSAQPDNAQSITRNLRNLPFDKPLRTEYQYSNGMYTVATHLIESVTGDSYAEFVKRQIWAPLGMSNTYHDVTGVEAGNATANLAMGHRWDKDSENHVEIPSYAQPEGQGAGCVFSSASNYAKWVRALLQRSGPLSEDSHKELVKGRTIVPYEGNDAIPLYGHSLYALGLIVESYRGHTVVGHDGSFDGFRALVRYLPGQDWGVVMFGNADDAFYVLQTLFHQLVDDLLRIPPDERTDWAAYWRKCQADEDQEENDDSEVLDSWEPLQVALESLAGTYYNDGYRTLVLAHKGRLEADCSDRGMPFILRFGHLSGNKFRVEQEYSLGKSTRKLKAEFDIHGDGTVKQLGIPLCDGMEDTLIWFQRVQ